MRHPRNVVGVCIAKWRRDRHLPLQLRLAKAAWYVISLVTAPFWLRACDTVGRGTRTRNRPLVVNDGTIDIGRNVGLLSQFFPVQLIAHQGSHLAIGDDTTINFGTTIEASSRIALGNRVRVGPYVTIVDRLDTGGRGAIQIGTDVWLAARVRVMPGITIGNGTIVAAGSVVANSLPANVIAAGNPARPLRLRAATPRDSQRTCSQRGTSSTAHDVVHRVGSAWGLVSSIARFWNADARGRRPRLHGTPHIENWGSLSIGDGVTIQSRPVPTHLVTGPNGKLVIGHRVTMGTGVGIAAHQRIAIGDDVTIGDYVLIMDTDFHDSSDAGESSSTAPVIIENSVRIDSHALILKGTHLRAGTHVPAGSVVRFNKTRLASGWDAGVK